MCELTLGNKDTGILRIWYIILCKECVMVPFGCFSITVFLVNWASVICTLVGSIETRISFMYSLSLYSLG